MIIYGKPSDIEQRGAYKLAAAGLMTALGLILPFFTSHAFGLEGTVLLPMHIPVLLCGLLCGPWFGVLCGLTVPVLSSLLTGMPVLYPMLPVMTAQLAAMGLAAGLLYNKLRLPVYLSLIPAAASGWLLYGLGYALLLFSGNSAPRMLSVTAAILRGVPGIIIQLLILPPLLAVLRRAAAGRTNGKDTYPLYKAKRMIAKKEVSCALIRNGRIIYTASGRGVSPLLTVYEQNKELLKDSFAVDKIIGKAAAIILVLGGAREAYGEIMSVAARDFLTLHAVTVSYGRCVDVISSRDGKGICPIEKSVLDIDDPSEGLLKLKQTLVDLKKQAG